MSCTFCGKDHNRNSKYCSVKCSYRNKNAVRKSKIAQIEADKVMISRECALEALHAMQNDQARPDFQCGELNEAIDQLKQALEKV